MNLLKEFQNGNCRVAPAPAAPPTSSPPQVVAEVMGKERHGLFRRIVGKLARQVCLRPDSAFIVMGLARPANGPTDEDITWLKHLLRCIKGSLHFKKALGPLIALSAEIGQETDLRVHSDANWAGWPSMGKSTSGALLLLCACPIRFVPKTQSEILSSTQGDLHAIGTGTRETLYVQPVLMGTECLSTLNIVLETGSSPGEPTAITFGTMVRARHL